VIASNSDEYGSSLVKTYAAVIRFYAPAPTGIDPTQDDFAQTVLGQNKQSPAKGLVKRLWVPIGICLTSNLPIIGVMEAMLLRLCEELVAKVGASPSQPSKLDEIHKALANLIVNFQKPIAGAVNCSVPFLSGERFLLSLPPPTGLPPLPHGRSIVSVCRLVGAEGLNFLIAAVLTECKILIHSQDIADIAMVAEVVTALVYPFKWSLPYIPILPLGMIEFVEAPLSYMLGVPSSSMQMVDPRALDEIVVVDLDNGFSTAEYSEGRRASSVLRIGPTPLPASVATNISKAVYRLLRAEEEVEEEFGGANLGSQSLPRLEAESLAEREFRISVAIEVCGLLRGYQECVGPVFNRDKFLKIAPALFEERRDTKGVGAALGSRSGSATGPKMISPRSKRFLSGLVNTQNFHQLLETLEEDETSFFHEIMDTFDDSSSDRDGKPTRSVSNGSTNPEKALGILVKALQKVEDKIPTYRVDKASGLDAEDSFDDHDLFFGDEDDGFQDFDDFHDEPDIMASGDGNMATSFTNHLLAPIEYKPEADADSSGDKQSVSLAYLAKLESNPWEYKKIISVPLDSSGSLEPFIEINEKVKLREAIGERRYRTWKMAQDQKTGGEVDLAFTPENLRASKQGASIDLTSLISSATADTSDISTISSGSSSLRVSTLTPEQQRVVDAKDRDIIRRCLDRAHQRNAKRNSRPGNDGSSSNPFLENGRDLIAESEKALRNPSAQRFLLSILAQRSRLENQRVRTMRRQSAAAQSSVSRLEQIAFDCLIRLSCAVLDSCMEYKEYEPAYRLLTHTAGFIMLHEKDDSTDEDVHATQVVTMSSRIGFHPIFADLGVWETVMEVHLLDRQSERKSELRSNEDTDDDEEEDEDAVEYEAAVATLYDMVGYGIPGEELSRFAMRASEEHGWFCDDRGRQLLMLARRISVRRDQAELGAAGEAGDIEMIRKGQDNGQTSSNTEQSVVADKENEEWLEIGWCHPAAPTSRKSLRTEKLEGDEDYMKRSPVTALASFDSTAVVTGGLDGSVFLAHSISDGSNGQTPAVRGIHLDWGSASRAGTGTSSDGEYGVGAVSCLAAAFGSGHHGSTSTKKDTGGSFSEEDVIASMEGSRVVAGTTAGDLRVWSVKDVYSALVLAKKGEEADSDPRSSGGGGNASTRLQFSLRGRALSGHRGGVTCIDVPSHVYRPDSLVTGGADGLIKLWSLRAPTGGRLPAAGSAASESAIISGSSDRSIALWDARVKNSPLFMLRHHQSRISDLLVGSRTDPLMVSAAADGTVASWDFRTLSGSSSDENSTKSSCQVVQLPSPTMRHGSDGKRRLAAGPVRLARVVGKPMESILSVGSDAIVREWATETGKLLDEAPTGHCCDAVSRFLSFGNNDGLSLGMGPRDRCHQGTLTSSWDGTIRMRKLVRDDQ
jgi:WD40 repeat protein